jgi:hypothetical protein
MKKLLLGICLALPVAAMAQDFSYAYIDGSYGETEADDSGEFDLEFENYDVTLGLQPTERIYTKLGGRWSELDGYSADDVAVFGAVGGRWQLADCVDFYVGGLAAYEELKDLPLGIDDVDGYGLGAELGLRAWLFPQLEVEANGKYVDLFEGDIDELGGDQDYTSAGLTARIHATRQFSITAGYSYDFDRLGDDLETWSVGARYDFCCM